MHFAAFFILLSAFASAQVKSVSLNPDPIIPLNDNQNPGGGGVLDVEKPSPLAPQEFDGFNGTVQEPFAPSAEEKAQMLAAEEKAKKEKLEAVAKQKKLQAEKLAKAGKAARAKRLPASVRRKPATHAKPKSTSTVPKKTGPSTEKSAQPKGWSK